MGKLDGKVAIVTGGGRALAVVDDVTDNEYFVLPSRQQGIDEANFWQFRG